jgi:hypothetical protein
MFLKHIIIFYVNYLVYIKIYRIFAIRLIFNYLNKFIIP